MHIISKVLIGLIAAIHSYILILEMFQHCLHLCYGFSWSVYNKYKKGGVVV